jgi:hypothetical protein
MPPRSLLIVTKSLPAILSASGVDSTRELAGGRTLPISRSGGSPRPTFGDGGRDARRNIRWNVSSLHSAVALRTPSAIRLGILFHPGVRRALARCLPEPRAKSPFPHPSPSLRPGLAARSDGHRFPSHSPPCLGRSGRERCIADAEEAPGNPCPEPSRDGHRSAWRSVSSSFRFVADSRPSIRSPVAVRTTRT